MTITAEEILALIINEDSMDWYLDTWIPEESISLRLEGHIILPNEAEKLIDSLHKQELREAINEALDHGLYMDTARELLERVQKEVFNEG